VSLSAVCRTMSGPGLQLTAARAALDFLFRAHDHETLARQIEALKRQIEEITRADSRTHQADARPGNAPGKQDDGTGRAQPSARHSRTIRRS
jgi:glutamate-1-semialdehyde aminotransferase